MASNKSTSAAVVGIDIGTDSIKFAEAKLGKDGVSITGLGIARTPDGALEGEFIVDAPAVASAIKTLLQDNHIKTRTCVSSIGGQSRTVTRVVEVPKGTDKELAETMKWEVERQVPFSPDDIEMDFAALRPPSDDPNVQSMEVLLAVAQSEHVQSHVDAIMAAGLKPVAIDVPTLAAGRALIPTEYEQTPDEEITGVLSIGAENTDLGIFENGVLVFPSPPIGIAGSSFTREISEALGVSMEEADLLKKEYASVDLNAFGAAGGFDIGAMGEQTSYDVGYDTAYTSYDTPFAGDDTAMDADAAFAPADMNDLSPGLDIPGIDQPVDEGGFSFDAGMEAASDELTPEGASDFEMAGPFQPDSDFGGGEEVQPEFTQEAADSVTDWAPAGPDFDLGEEAESILYGQPGLDEPAPAAEEVSTGAEPAGDTHHFDFTLDQTVAPAGTPQPDYDFSDIEDSSSFQPLHVDTGVVSDDPQMTERVFQAISSVLVDLATEIRRSIEYYNVRYSKMPQKIILCGGTAKMPHLDEFLAGELGMPVEVAAPFTNAAARVPDFSEYYLKEIAPLFSVSIGLAIRDMVG